MPAAKPRNAGLPLSGAGSHGGFGAASIRRCCRSPSLRLLALLAALATAVLLLWPRPPAQAALRGTPFTPLTPDAAAGDMADALDAGEPQQEALGDFEPEGLPQPQLSFEQRRFLQTLPIRKPPDLPPGFKYFDSLSASRITNAERLRRFKLSGFKYCKMLDGSIFDALVHLHPIGGSLAQTNPLVSSVTALLDSIASNITDFIRVKFEEVDPEDAKRYACYAVAEGNNPSANLSDERFVHSFDPDEYFSAPLPAIRRRVPDRRPARSKYLIAYLIMVHEEAGFNQLKMLLDILDDGNAIILIHVDKSAERLYKLVTDFLAERAAVKSIPQGNVFLAKNRYANTWGHISIVFTQLSGFWELYDLAEWDYIVNLSNYDWPLRNNVEAHAALELHRGHSYIDYWNDTEAIAKRSFRPHLGKADHSGIYQPPELSITSWPFPHWKAYKQMQWMILSRAAVQFFRQSRDAINYLAFMEHSLMPEESFFATALVNSKQFSKLLQRDKKRYVRSPNDNSAPAWIGWSDRHIFRPNEVDPEFLFLRPFNVLGEFFGETKLIEWIRVNHLTRDPLRPCHRDQLGYRDECLREIASAVADLNELIVVPANLDYLPLVENLRCSLLRAGMRNILHWAIDIQTHDKLIESGHLSFFMPNIRGSPHHYNRDDKSFTKLMRNKPKVIRRLLHAGFHVIYLDADTVVTRDFRKVLRRYARETTFADIVVGIDQKQVVEPTTHVKTPPRANAGVMYVRNTERSRQLIDEIIGRQKYDPTLDDQEALREVLAQPRRVLWTGIGAPSTGDAYPQDAAAGDQDAQAAEGANSGFMPDIFGLGSGVAPVQYRDDGRTRVHFLDQIEFINGNMFFDNKALLPSGYNGFYVVHANGQSNPREAFKQRGLWVVDDLNRCVIAQIETVPDPNGPAPLNQAAAAAAAAAAAQAQPASGPAAAAAVNKARRPPSTNDDTKYNDAVQREIAKGIGGAGGASGGSGGAKGGAGDTGGSEDVVQNEAEIARALAAE